MANPAGATSVITTPLTAVAPRFSTSTAYVRVSPGATGGEEGFVWIERAEPVTLTETELLLRGSPWSQSTEARLLAIEHVIGAVATMVTAARSSRSAASAGESVPTPQETDCPITEQGAGFGEPEGSTSNRALAIANPAGAGAARTPPLPDSASA